MAIADLVDKHFYYAYDNGWRYELWIKAADRVAYKVHGGPMKGRENFQKAYIIEIKEKEMYQVSWIEETGTIISILIDLTASKLTTFMAFSRGHWDNPEKARGDKRNPEDFARWRTLNEIGSQVDRHVIPATAIIDQVTHGKDALQDVDMEHPTH